MKGIILILLPVLLGLGSGIGAGLFLAPPPEQADMECDPAHDDSCSQAEDEEHQAKEDHDGDAEAAFDYVKLGNQFVVPIVRDERVGALVVVSLTLEVTLGTSSEIFGREPKLRDAFLQEMFDFAYLGGFDGPFTKSENLVVLRRALLETAQKIAGRDVKDVLITDIVRQEV